MNAGVMRWDNRTIYLLNRLQKTGHIHPFTCGGGGGPCSGVDLVATRDGWKCPSCGSLQVGDFSDAVSLAEMYSTIGWPSVFEQARVNRLKMAKQ